jgi:hypothetical protein
MAMQAIISFAAAREGGDSMTCGATLIDSRNVRYGNGKVFKTPSDIEEYRTEGEDVILRYTNAGSSVREARACWNAIPRWEVRAPVGMMFSPLPPGYFQLQLDGTLIHLPGPVQFAVVHGDQVMVTLHSDPKDMQNVYCYDVDGSLRWRIMAPPPDIKRFAYVQAFYNDNGELVAINNFGIVSHIDLETGNIIAVETNHR